MAIPTVNYKSVEDKPFYPMSESSAAVVDTGRVLYELLCLGTGIIELCEAVAVRHVHCDRRVGECQRRQRYAVFLGAWDSHSGGAARCKRNRIKPRNIRK